MRVLPCAGKSPRSALSITAARAPSELRAASSDVATPTALMHKTHSLTFKREVEFRLSRVVESSVAEFHGLRARRERGCRRRFGIVPFVSLLQLELGASGT